MKKFTAILLMLAMLFSLAACTDGNETAENSTVAPTNSTVIPTDQTVALANELKSSDLEGKQIQMAYTTADRYKIYDTIASLSEDAEQIVQGKITHVSYFNVDQVPYTKMDVQINSVISGDFSVGDTISTYKGGGYIALSDYLPGIQDRNPNLTNEEILNTVVDVRQEGDPHPTVGEEVVLFLRIDPHASVLTNGMYAIVSGYFGQFTQGDDGDYTRHIEYIPEDGYNSITTYSLNNQPEIDRSQMTGANRSFSYEALVSEIENSLTSK